MPATQPAPLKEQIKDLIDASQRTLTDIAAEADVSFDVLYNWYSGRSTKLDVEIAEAVVVELGGKGFL
jgi:hypothetical protein